MKARCALSVQIQSTAIDLRSRCTSCRWETLLQHIQLLTQSFWFRNVTPIPGWELKKGERFMQSFSMCKLPSSFQRKATKIKTIPMISKGNCCRHTLVWWDILNNPLSIFIKFYVILLIIVLYSTHCRDKIS